MSTWFSTTPTHARSTWRGPTRSRYRLTFTGVAVAAAVFLTACSQDQVKRTAISAPRDGASKVITGVNEIDLIDGLTSTPVTASTGAVGIWNQAGSFKVGTGVINPFLSVQAAGAEQGFNTDGTFTLDQTRSQFTNGLPLNQVPVIAKNGGSFREFIFDANEANSTPDAQFSIDQFNMWLCNTAAADTFSTRARFESNGNCVKLYDLNGKTLLATDANSLGSGGDFDYQILIPDAAFQAAASAVHVIADCSYAGPDATSCGAFIILDVKMGYKGGDWVTGSTFEEFSTLKRPFVKVTKTAVPSYTRRYNWRIEKSVNPTDIYLFDGQSQNASWGITVTPGSPAFTDSNISVSGAITIANTSDKTVTVLSIADAIAGYGAVNLTCPSGLGPITLAKGATYVCTYTVAAPNANAGVQTNTATVTVDAGADVDPATFTGSANFNFASVTPTEIDKNPNVYDNYNGEGEVLKGTASGSPFSYTKTYTCGSTTDYTNVARVDLTGVTDPTATATMHLHCLSLTVTKTAATSVNRTFNWLISKSVTPTSWTLFNGDQGTSAYTVTATPNGFSDAGLTATGDITIHNPNSVSVYLQSLPTDVITGLTGSTVTCPKVGTTTVFPYELTAGSDLVCSYTKALPNGFTSATNTATVSAKPTPTGTSKNFSGTATVNAASATATETNKTVHITDNFNATGAVALGTATWGTGTTPGAPTVLHPQNRTFSCPTGQASYTNIATITETSQTAQATVTVTCRDLTVTKTAVTKYRRKWTWTVNKTIDPTSTNLTLDIGQSYIVNYTVVYASTPAEDNFRVGGTVTVTNPASAGPAATTTATINSLTDVVSPSIAAALTCPSNTFPQTLAAGATLVCTYTDVALGDKTARVNTATAKRANMSFASNLAATSLGTETTRSNTANVTFGSTPTEALDECVNVSDSNPGTTVTGSKCAGDANKTFTYQKTLQYQTCGAFTVPNTASFTSTAGTTGSISNTATPLTGSASVLINVTVNCPQGCTLTLGYWKTHNDSFKGGAPSDDNWDNLPAAELTGFFTNWSPTYPVAGPNASTTFTWFNVFWTAPKGNAYYQLAHQYMAAKLNYLNNAGQVPAVTSAITAAETFFAGAGNTPAGWTSGSTTKSQLLGWAATLGSYNEGTIGPGHCSEDRTSGQ